MSDRNQGTPEQRARMGDWIDEVRAIAQLSQDALADLVEQELREGLPLTRRQYNILEEVQDRLRERRGRVEKEADTP